MAAATAVARPDRPTPRGSTRSRTAAASTQRAAATVRRTRAPHKTPARWTLARWPTAVRPTPATTRAARRRGGWRPRWTRRSRCPRTAAQSILHAAGAGTQNYACTMTDAGTVWTLTGPSAVLSDCHGMLVGHHFASEAGVNYPEWETTDGTYVIGDRIGHFIPDGGAGLVSWLLCRRSARAARARWAEAAYVQRLFPMGAWHATGCDAGDRCRFRTALTTTSTESRSCSATVRDADDDLSARALLRKQLGVTNLASGNRLAIGMTRAPSATAWSNAARRSGSGCAQW